MPERPRPAATPADAIAAILRGTPACWTSSPTTIQLPDLSDESGRKTIKVDPSILGNVAAAKGWLGIPAARADGKRPRLTPQQRVAKRLTECMQAIASQAVEQARIAGLQGETAMMVAAVDAAQRGLLAGLVAVQGTLVAPPAEAAEEHRRGRKTQAERSTGGTISKRPPKSPDEDIRQAMDLVSWSDYRGPGADINYYTDVARHTAKITSKRTGKDVKPYHYKTIANRIRNMSKPRRKPSPQ